MFQQLFPPNQLLRQLLVFPDVLVVNQPSIDKFAHSIRPGGVLIYNTNMCPRGYQREDIIQIAVPMNMK